MAPEIFKESYDYKIDIWALGILLYEMLHKTTPFKASSNSAIKENILNREITPNKGNLES